MIIPSPPGPPPPLFFLLVSLSFIHSSTHPIQFLHRKSLYTIYYPQLAQNQVQTVDPIFSKYFILGIYLGLDMNRALDMTSNRPSTQLNKPLYIFHTSFFLSFFSLPSTLL